MDPLRDGNRKLPFALELTGRGGSLRAEGVEHPPWLRVEALTVALPELGGRFDFSAGASGFRHHRGRLVEFDAVFDLATIEEELASRLATAGSPVRDIRILPHGPLLVIRARLDDGENSARVVWRACVVPAGDVGADALLISVQEARVVGWFPRAGLSLAHDIIGALPEWLVRRQALSHAVLRPLRRTLVELMAGRGWKLPAHRTATTREATLDGTGLRVIWRAATADSPLDAPVASGRSLDPRGRALHELFVRDLELKRHYTRADSLIADGATDEAIRQLGRQLAGGGDREFHEGRLLDVLRARELGLDACEELAERVLALDDRHRGAALALAAVHERRGRPERGAELLGRLAATLDRDTEGAELEDCLLHQAELLERVSASDGAGRVEEVLRRLLTARPGCGEALERLAAVLDARGEGAEAARLRGRLLAADVPVDCQRRAALAIAEHHLAAGRSGEAGAYIAFLEAHGISDDTRLALHAAQASSEGHWERAAGMMHERLAGLLAGDDRDAARAVATELAELLERRLARPGEAARVRESAAEVLGATAAELAGIAEQHRRGGDVVAARRLQERALDLLGVAPEGAEERAMAASLHASLATSLAAVEDGASGARRHLLGALDLEPASTAALEGLEALASAPEHWDELAARMHAALAAPEGAVIGLATAARAEVTLRLALIYSRTFGFPHEAVPLLEDCLELEPANRFALRHLVAVTRQLGDWERHRAALARALAVARDRGERVATLVSLAEVESDRMGRPAEARRHLEQALAERPRDRDVLSRLAALLREARDYGALAAIMRRLAATTADAQRRQQLFMDLAELQLRALQRPAEAEATLYQAAACGPTPPRLAELIEAVASALGAPARPAVAPARPAVAPARPAAAPAPVPAPAAPAVVPPTPAPAVPVAPAPASAPAPAPSAGQGGGGWFAALTLADHGDVPGAIVLLERLVAADPGDSAAQDLLAVLREQVAAKPAPVPAPTAAVPDVAEPGDIAPPPPEPVPQSVLDQEAQAKAIEEGLRAAASALEDGRPEDARAEAMNLLALDPDCLEAFELLAAAGELLGDAKARATALGGLAERAFVSDDARRLNREAAEAWDEAGDRARATAYYRRYLRWAPLDEQVFLRLVDEARAGGDASALRALLEDRVEGLQRLRVESGDDTVGVTLSLTRTELGCLLDEEMAEPETALQVFAQAHRDWPRNEEALERLVGLLEERQDWERLAESLEALVGITEDRGLRGARLKRLVEIYRGPLRDPVAARETLRVALRELPPDEAAPLRAALEGEI